MAEDTPNQEADIPPKIECRRFVFGRLKISTTAGDENTSILNGLIQKLQSSRRSGSLPSKGSAANITNCDTSDLVHDHNNDYINMFKNTRVTSREDNPDCTEPEVISQNNSKPFISLIDGREISPPHNLQTNPLAVSMKSSTYFGRTITSPSLRPPPMPIPPKNNDSVLASSRTILSKPKFTKPILQHRRFSETALQVPSSLKTNFIKPASDMSDH